ncbi:MAG: hypothetical protein RIS70_1879 [Planctomycetota bacterium]
MAEGTAETPRYQPLVVVAAAQAAGIVADRYVNPGLALWLTLCAGSLMVWLIGWRRDRLAFSGIALCLAIAGLSGVWHGRMWRWFDRDEVGLSVSEVPGGVVAEVVARTTPRVVPAGRPDPLNVIRRGERTRMEVEFIRVRAQGGWIAASGRSVLTVEGRLTGIVAGDRLRVSAMASRWEPPANPGEVDFSEFARGDRRLFRMYAESPVAVRRIQSEEAWRWRVWVERLRESARQRLDVHVPAAQAGLTSAILLGTREGLDAESVELFFITGVSHLIAISGLNVAIFSYGFWWVARSGLFSRRVALILAMGLAAGYAVLTESQSPVVRAAVLVVCVCFARFGARRNLGFNALAASAIFVMCMQPSALFQTGTQLSFLAVAVLCMLETHRSKEPVDPLDRLIAQLRPWPVRWMHSLAIAFWELFRTSAVVWIIALPLVWYRFRLISPIALLLNPLVVLPMAMALYFGFAALVCSWCSSTSAQLFGWACGKCLAFIEYLLRMGSKIPGNHVWFPAPDLVWVLACYGVLVLWAVMPGYRPPRRWLIAGLLVIVASGLWSARLMPRGSESELTCTFAAVGHGTAVLLELPGGVHVLYDAGHLGNPATVAQSLSACLWSKGITHLDAIVISHADLDHYNAVPTLLERFSVGVVYVSPGMIGDSSESLDVLWGSIAARGVRLRVLSEGDRFVIGHRPTGTGRIGERRIDESRIAKEPVTMRVLHPPKGGVPGSDNANSIVLCVEYAGDRLLLTGDIEAAGLERLLQQPPLDCDIVMAPHHGSRFSEPRLFLEWSKAEWVVSSCSRRSDGRVLREACDELGIGSLRTVDVGAVEFRWGEYGRFRKVFRDKSAGVIELSR